MIETLLLTTPILIQQQMFLIFHLYTVEILVTDQDGASAQVSYVITVTDSMNDFVFVDSAIGNDNSGDGSIGNPFATMARIYGADNNATGFRQAAIVLAAGNYDVPNIDGNFELNANKPMVWLAYTGETVVLDFDTIGSKIRCSTL